MYIYICILHLICKFSIPFISRTSLTFGAQASAPESTRGTNGQPAEIRELRPGESTWLVLMRSLGVSATCGSSSISGFWVWGLGFRVIVAFAIVVN